MPHHRFLFPQQLTVAFLLDAVRLSISPPATLSSLRPSHRAFCPSCSCSSLFTLVSLRRPSARTHMIPSRAPLVVALSLLPRHSVYSLFSSNLDAGQVERRSRTHLHHPKTRH